MKLKTDSSIRQEKSQFVKSISKITIYALVILALVASTKAGANGTVDIQVGETDKRVAAQVRITRGFFALADVDTNIYMGLGYGWQYNAGEIILGYTERNEVQLGATYRHPKTEWSVDGKLIDDLDESSPRFDFGLSYHLGAGKAAVRLAYEQNKWWIGIRRTL